MLPQAAKISLRTKVMEAITEEMKFNRGFEDGSLRIPLNYPKITQVTFRVEDSRAMIKIELEAESKTPIDVQMYDRAGNLKRIQVRPDGAMMINDRITNMLRYYSADGKESDSSVWF